ncbi:hypothetical protein RRG08_000475 [Elysia crispata]|uniref:Uncharacterized protein n=1 Tax=Elysia crispata TaxID=231223 RepID=A0AAE0YC39_9GAST|nr:hypothetical protein RRG08_000475 [Elysia crispata]
MCQDTQTWRSPIAPTARTKFGQILVQRIIIISAQSSFQDPDPDHLDFHYRVLYHRPAVSPRNLTQVRCHLTLLAGPTGRDGELRQGGRGEGRDTCSSRRDTPLRNGSRSLAVYRGTNHRYQIAKGRLLTLTHRSGSHGGRVRAVPLVRMTRQNGRWRAQYRKVKIKIIIELSTAHFSSLENGAPLVIQYRKAKIKIIIELSTAHFSSLENGAPLVIQYREAKIKIIIELSTAHFSSLENGAPLIIQYRKDKIKIIIELGTAHFSSLENGAPLVIQYRKDKIKIIIELGTAHFSSLENGAPLVIQYRKDKIKIIIELGTAHFSSLENGAPLVGCVFHDYNVR